MKKIYLVTKDFWVGECNIQLKKGQEVSYDDETNYLIVGDKSMEAKFLKATIKSKWLIPVDGKYPELDGPVGETEDEKMDRKRSERFAQQASKKKDVKGLVKDERQVGLVSEESEMFKALLHAEPVASVKVGNKSKKAMDLIQDDTKEVGKASFDKSETMAMKKALKQDESGKQDPSKFKVYNDHYDAESLLLGTYSNDTNESTIKGWSTLHWTKKAEVISATADKTFLNQLKSLETSKKIKERISEKLDTL